MLYRIANFCEMILGALGEKLILSEQTNQLLTDIKAKVPSSFDLNKSRFNEPSAPAAFQAKSNSVDKDDKADLSDVSEVKAPAFAPKKSNASEPSSPEPSPFLPKSGSENSSSFEPSKPEPSPFLPKKDSGAIDDLDDLDDVLNGKSPFKPMGQSPFKPLSDK